MHQGVENTLTPCCKLHVEKKKGSAVPATLSNFTYDVRVFIFGCAGSLLPLGVFL